MDKTTIDTYNKMALEYDQEVAEFWNIFPRTILDTFAQNISGKVLDVGSGSGRDALILKEAGLQVTCLDASTAMIALTRNKGLTSVLADFNDLPFANESFDGVWAYTSLLHTPKTQIKKPLAEIYRVLKNGGVFGLGLIEGDTEEYRASSGVELPRFFAYYKKEGIENLLKELNFSIFYFDSFCPKTRNYLHFLARK
ncbi:MAG: class I SAM-dependent methyltransferase [Candidatus Wildermuthbacteria bacterium]|nr:class I SAM-dependent methyltransferase [Candidatus Wildermuthbacteria bacterium]